ncbi:SGNH/GDSL hydrolase family protein [Archangium lipolyticum]|uniref:SGNH/GDSL hydrolase family protein n=1 Tax=Archangium lipolyticum TaxID=2970465 RepID=UPI00214A369F|nr:SGNH/GDSL hydrolase family protein [Archangium lipolyticum]
MKHIVLLGDSIFDNGAYVSGGPDVIQQLRERLPAGWQATLRAVDGSVTSGVKGQLHRLPKDASHLVISVGGNDALGQSSVLERGARSVADAVGKLADIQEEFGRSYQAMLDHVLALGLPTAVCTIYDANYPDAGRQRLVVTALSVFNDCITREAFARGLPLVDLRLICDRAEDYANPIEPSVRGGEKISAAILRLVTEHDFSRRRAGVFT